MEFFLEDAERAAANDDDGQASDAQEKLGEGTRNTLLHQQAFLLWHDILTYLV